jgi:hypothetical protein
MKVPLPESDANSSSDDASSSSTDSDSSSDSDSEVETETKTKTKATKSTSPVTTGNHSSSDSSATLDKTSPKLYPVDKFAPLPPDPATVKANNRGKNNNNGNGNGNGKTVTTPFSRVNRNIQVDPRFASNAFQGHDWGRKAHEDLAVTRGKGFTKEKNKKKRGSYRGGRIDTNAVGGIKFED